MPTARQLSLALALVCTALPVDALQASALRESVRAPLIEKSSRGPRGGQYATRMMVPSAAAAVPMLHASAAVRSAPPSLKTVVAPEDFRLALALTAVGVLIISAPLVPGGFFTILGLFLLFQTLRIRFVFDDDAFEVKTKELDQIFSADSELIKTGDNFAVGGDNRWAYSSVVNWEFFPSEDLPILVYFKETQTPQDKWDVGPGKWANSEEAMAKGAKKGQVHFFPCIASASALKEQFESRGCAKL